MRLNYLFLIILLATITACVSTSPKDSSMELPQFDDKWDFNDPEGTEKTFLLILNSMNFEDEPEYHLQLRTQIARAQGLQQKFKEAHSTLDGVETDLVTNYHIARVRYLLERGRVFNSSGNGDRSISYFLEAWELGVMHDLDFYAVDAAHMLGMIEAPETQLSWNEKAVELAERSADPEAKKWLGSLYNNIGWSHHGMNEFEKALENFIKTYEWYAERDDKKHIRIAEWSIARAHRSLGDLDKALEMQNKLAREMAVSGEEDGYVYEEIAECLYAKGELQKAQPAFLKAWEILSQDIWLQQNEAERLSRLKKMGSPTP